MGVLISDVISPRDVEDGADLAVPKTNLRGLGVTRTKEIDDLCVCWLHVHHHIMDRIVQPRLLLVQSRPGERISPGTG